MSYGIRKRYQDDPAFATLVDTLHALIEKADFTPTEIREAAMLAQIIYEERHPRPITFSRDQIMRGEL